MCCDQLACFIKLWSLQIIFSPSITSGRNFIDWVIFIFSVTYLLGWFGDWERKGSCLGLEKTVTVTWSLWGPLLIDSMSSQAKWSGTHVTECMRSSEGIFGDGSSPSTVWILWGVECQSGLLMNGLCTSSFESWAASASIEIRNHQEYVTPWWQGQGPKGIPQRGHWKESPLSSDICILMKELKDFVVVLRFVCIYVYVWNLCEYVLHMSRCPQSPEVGVWFP